MNRLREIRAIKRIRQFDLTIKTGIPQSRLSFIENELVIPKENEMKRLAKALGLQVKDIFNTMVS